MWDRKCWSADANDFHLFWLIEFSKFISGGGDGELRKIQFWEFSRFSIYFNLQTLINTVVYRPFRLKIQE